MLKMDGQNDAKGGNQRARKRETEKKRERKRKPHTQQHKEWMNYLNEGLEYII